MLLYIAIDGRFLQAVESALPCSPFICLLPAIWSLKSHWLALLCRRSQILGYSLDRSLRLWWSLQGSCSSSLIHWQGYTYRSAATEWAWVCCVRKMTNLSLSSMCHPTVLSVQVVEICPSDDFRGNKDSDRGGYKGLFIIVVTLNCHLFLSLHAGLRSRALFLTPDQSLVEQLWGNSTPLALCACPVSSSPEVPLYSRGREISVSLSVALLFPYFHWEKHWPHLWGQ